MKIRLVEIPEGGLKIEDELKQSWLQQKFNERDFDLYQSESPVFLNLRVQKIKRRITVKGKVTATVSFNCSRCNESGTTPLTVNINEAFLPEDSRAVYDKRTVDLDLRDFKNSTYTDDEVDIGDYIVESVMLTLPVFPKCGSETCQSGSMDYIEEWDVTEEEIRMANSNPAWKRGLGEIQHLFKDKKPKG